MRTFALSIQNRRATAIRRCEYCRKCFKQISLFGLRTVARRTVAHRTVARGQLLAGRLLSRAVAR